MKKWLPTHDDGILEREYKPSWALMSFSEETSNEWCPNIVRTSIYEKCVESVAGNEKDDVEYAAKAEKEAFDKWFAAVSEENVVGLNELAHICVDEVVRKELYERACQIRTEEDDEFVSTIATVNRQEDADKVKER